MLFPGSNAADVKRFKVTTTGWARYRLHWRAA
jgi:hypothetical protein